VRERFIGLMSGTSADGVDAVIAKFDHGRFVAVEASLHLPHPNTLRQQLISLGRDAQAAIKLSALAALDIAVADQFAAITRALLAHAGLQAADIRAIGSHGQTIFHDPKGSANSLQIGDPNRIAALTGIPVVADFRRMDIALAGEGAPLVPAFHQAVFASEKPTAVVNIGGIANITLLGGSTTTPTIGFDCGPGNALMDEWASLHLKQAYDAHGHFAAQGRVLPDLLKAWLSEPYFGAPAPKSTGRGQFNLDWAAALAQGGLAQHAAADVQATLCELTATTIVAVVPSDTTVILICGGGAYNDYLMHRIAALAAGPAVQATAALGLPPECVEAAAFAWLARQRVHGLPGNLPTVTGAKRSALLGGIYG